MNMPMNRSFVALTPDQIRVSCPSFFAEHPKEDVSGRYAFLNTAQISNILGQYGWLPTSAKECRCVDIANKGFTKHMIRWAHQDLELGNERVEIVGVNSHNRSAAFQFMLGIFRLVCTNGLVAKTSDFGSFSVRHVGDIHAQVMDMLSQVTQLAGSISGQISEYKTIDLSPDEQGVFALSAHQLMFDEPEQAPIPANRLLAPRRQTDMADRNGIAQPKGDLWTTFNVVQENMIKGKMRGYNYNTHKRVTVRGVKSIDRDVKLNQALWALTQRMAELKKIGVQSPEIKDELF